MEKARNGQGPTLIEALTYRLGPHTSSDDPRRYREEGEVESWRNRDPLRRFRLYLENMGIWSEKDEVDARDIIVQTVKDAISYVEKLPAPDVCSLFDDVYSKPTWNLKREVMELEKEQGVG